MMLGNLTMCPATFSDAQTLAVGYNSAPDTDMAFQPD